MYIFYGNHQLFVNHQNFVFATVFVAKLFIANLPTDNSSRLESFF